MIRLIIADDESITRKGLAMLDWAAEGFEVAGIASNGLEALEQVRDADAELLLTDIRMPGMDGLTLMGELAKERPSLKVIFITAYHQLDYALEAIKLGAHGFVLKPTDPDEILEACRKAKQAIEEEKERQRQDEGLRKQLKEYSLTLQGKILSDQEEGPGSSIVQEVLAHMEERYMEEITVESLARLHHFNPDYLSRLFKKETGENLMNALTRIRMQKAVELLADSRIKAYEIAEKVGIKDSRYFGQIFKKRYGVTLGEFRKRHFPGQTPSEEE